MPNSLVCAKIAQTGGYARAESKYKSTSPNGEVLNLPQSSTVSFYPKVGPARGEDFCTNGLLAHNTASYQIAAKVILFFFLMNYR